MRVDVLTAATVTQLSARHAGAVVVAGSHGGTIAAAYAAAARVRAVVFNDAGRGRDDAGTAGLAALDALGIAACAVAHTSARIGDAADALAHGVVSAVNAAAAAAGVAAGMPCAVAADRLRAAPWREGVLPFPAEARALLVAAADGAAPVWGLDSIGLVAPSDADAVLVIGSHGALHGGDPASALPVAARAAFFHDAGRGKDDAGASRLPVLSARGVPAAVVDYRTARIGDARSLWESGELSVVNDAAARLGVRSGQPVAFAAAALRRAAARDAAAPVRATACPRCGQPNDCAPARSGDFATVCWCADLAVDPALLAALPASVRGGGCLCRRCLTALREGPAGAAGA